MKRLPQIYDIEALRESLDDGAALIKAFVWGDSGEGHDFWSAQHAFGPTESGRAILLEMIAAAEGGEITVAA